MIKIGDIVKWKWGRGFSRAEVIELRLKATTITTKGAKVTRDATSSNPALILRNKNGVKILKLASEVEKA